MAAGDDARRIGDAVARAQGSIKQARANLDSVMLDVHALPESFKTNVCRIIEHAFDELVAAEHELDTALVEQGDEGGRH